MRVLIVDDEQPARARLEQIIGDFPGYECAGLAANGEEALRLVTSERPDIVLLDIRMPGLGGMEVAQHLNTLDKPPAVVFTTAYDEYAIDAFEARAVGYILKPVRRQRLEAALEQAARLAPSTLGGLGGKLDTRRAHLCARRQGELRLIPIEGIVYLEADQKYVCVHHADGEDLIDEPLKSLESEFADRFVRIHRSVLVAIASIERIDRDAEGKSHVVLRNDSQDGGKALIISRRHVANVKRRLKGA
ncbi:MAG: LytTR family DNA-binding domain-containing protein [Pseudomonadota bacterium]